MSFHKCTIAFLCVLNIASALPRPKSNSAHIDTLNDAYRDVRINRVAEDGERLRRSVRYVYYNELSSGSELASPKTTTETRASNTTQITLIPTSESTTALFQNERLETATGGTGKVVDSKDLFREAGKIFKASVMAAGGKKAENVRVCLHKYNSVAHSARVSVDDGISGSSYDYEGVEYGDYEEREPVLSNMTVPGVGRVRVEHCAKPSDFCYALWSPGAAPGQVAIIGQGCWESSDIQEACSREVCSSEQPPPRAKPETKFCCCNSDLCNASPVSPPPNTAIPSTEEIPILMVSHPAHGALGVLMLAKIGFFVLVAGGLLLALCCRLGKSAGSLDPDPEHGAAQETGGPGFSCSETCVDNLKVHDNIGEGRHAKVWRGSLGGVPVAVKALRASRVALWTRERELYCLPHMGHTNLLTYLGCDTRPTLEGSLEHLIVLQLAPLGSLRQYLTENTLDWDTYTKMALGVASALAHLHTHIDKDGQYKPCIVHRDVNSSNVVVRSDLTCCLADLGLAMALPDSMRAPQQHRIQEAGTLRYLSPEALEGALDLRRCGAALRAVDVYALALVLWELLSRCASAHTAPGPPDYAPPYHEQVGDQPTLEQMQLVVTRRKARPLFSPRLVSTRGARLARDTCEDCWDHDADARLTAVCVVERLSELRNLKPAPSPTINSNDLRPPNSGHDTTSNSHSPNSIEDKNSNVISSANLPNGNPPAILEQPLQPYQGRNPCLERNLASAGPGDRLIDKSLKDMPSNSSSSSTNGYGTNDFIRMEQSLSGSNLRNQPQDFSRNENQISNVVRNSNRLFTNQNSANLLNLDSIHDDLATNEFRTIVRPVTPIGYVQNDVSGVDVNSAVSNGECSHSHTVKRTNLKVENSRMRWSARNFKRLLDSKVFKKRRQQNRPLETEVNLIVANGKPINTSTGKIKTSVILNDTNGKVNCDDFRLNFVRNTDSSLADRPSSLPGIDSVSLSEDSSALNPETRINLQHFHDNTCTLSPPNRTLPASVMRQDRPDYNLVIGFKELPSGSQATNCVKNQNQVFAVIVPRVNYNGNCNDVNTKRADKADWKYRNGKALLSSHTNLEHIIKVENRLAKADEPQSASVSINNDSNTAKSGGAPSSKRYSCDEKIFTSGNRLYNFDGSDGGERCRPMDNSKTARSRNSYSGEFEVGNFCVYNNREGDAYEPGGTVDYSSNSEDEHMLLLSEDGGSKITMRQRFDAKPNDSKIKKKAKQNLNSNNGSATKIMAGSFTSLCNKYGPKGRYENFENETSENFTDPRGPGADMSVNSGNSLQDIRRKSSVIDRNDVSVISLARNGSSLSLCRKDTDDTSFTDVDSRSREIAFSCLPNGKVNHKVVEQNINERNKPNENGTAPTEYSTINKCDRIGDSNSEDSGDDTTLRDDVFTSERTPRPLSIKRNLSRQHSLELVSELFSSSADLTRLRDPADRIKTPGDVPPSVRRVRGVKRTVSAKEKGKSASVNRLSLYDDRMMFGNSL